MLERHHRPVKIIRTPEQFVGNQEFYPLRGSGSHTAKELTHGIKNDYTHALVALELARREIGNPDLYELVDTVINRLNRSTKNLDYLMRVTEGSQNMLPTKIEDVIRVSLAGKPIEREEEGQVQLDVDINEPLHTIMGDPGNLEMVFMDLTQNAFYAMHKRREREGEGTEMKLTIRARNEEDQVVIVVKDTGIGIEKENFDRLGEEGFTTKGDDGHGFGLSSVVKTIGAHKGSIEIRSVTRQMIKDNPDRYPDDTQPGTTFRITLPAYKPGHASSSSS